MERPNKIIYYIGIAKAGARRVPCSRRQFCAIIVKGDAIISIGYNGSARTTINCGLDIPCLKDLHDEESYKSYTHCPAVHAEENAIINAARIGVSVLGATMYLAEIKGRCQRPCIRCRRICINAGLKDAYFETKDGIKHEAISYWVELDNEWMTKQKITGELK